MSNEHGNPLQPILTIEEYREISDFLGEIGMPPREPDLLIKTVGMVYMYALETPSLATQLTPEEATGAREQVERIWGHGQNEKTGHITAGEFAELHEKIQADQTFLGVLSPTTANKLLQVVESHWLTCVGCKEVSDVEKGLRDIPPGVWQVTAETLEMRNAKRGRGAPTRQARPEGDPEIPNN